MNTRILVIIPLFISLLWACGRNAESLEGKSYEADVEQATESMDDMEVAMEEADVSSTRQDHKLREKQKSKESFQAIKKDNTKIIKTGEIGIQLKDYHKNKHQIYDAIRKNDAYLSRENERKESYRLSNNIEIRVPNNKFESLLDALTQGNGVANVDYKRMQAVDVGEQFYDLKTRIKTKKEVEKRYISILRQAKKIEDILAVEEKIRVIREEIEAAEGRLRFLSDQVSYSTISLYMYQNLEYDAPAPDRPTFWGKAGRAAQSGWNAILGFLLFLINVWPLLILIAAAFIAYRKKLIAFMRKD
jgi:hypothetical protein